MKVGAKEKRPNSRHFIYVVQKPVSSTKSVGVSTSLDPANGPTFGPLMKYTGTKQVFSSELSIWEARGGRVNEGQCRALRKSATGGVQSVCSPFDWMG